MYCDPLQNNVGTIVKHLKDSKNSNGVEKCNNKNEDNDEIGPGSLTSVSVCKNYLRMFQGPQQALISDNYILLSNDQDNKVLCLEIQEGKIQT